MNDTNLFYQHLENGYSDDELKMLKEEKLKTGVALRILLELPLTAEQQEWFDSHFSETLYSVTHKLTQRFYRLGGTPEELAHLREINKRDQ